MKKKFTKIHLIIGLVLILILTIFIVYQIQTSPLKKNSDPVLFSVTDEDQGLNSVIERLEKEGLIRSALFTKIEAKIKQYSNVYIGDYELKASDSSEEILKALNNPDYSNQEFEVQLKEGHWAKHMADSLAEKTAYTSDDFINLWNDKEYLSSLQSRYPFITDELINSNDLNVRLEGFLYPDTYRFMNIWNIKQITEKILDNSLDKYQLIAKEIDEFPLSIHDFYTLASIVEYEASNYEDMQMVAGVFMNRLEMDMPLQSSVTVCYSLYEYESWKECESGENLGVDSKFNTYKYQGLPPGPIRNPNISALKASLNYREHDYIYFVADVENVRDGKVYYQTNYAEHEKIRKELLGY